MLGGSPLAPLPGRLPAAIASDWGGQWWGHVSGVTRDTHTRRTLPAWATACCCCWTPRARQASGSFQDIRQDPHPL